MKLFSHRRLIDQSLRFWFDQANLQFSMEKCKKILFWKILYSHFFINVLEAVLNVLDICFRIKIKQRLLKLGNDISRYRNIFIIRKVDQRYVFIIR